MAKAPAISYVTGDFSTIMDALKVHIQSRFGTVWKSFYESDMGQALMELYAFCADQALFYLNVSANEQFITTARDRSSLIRLGKLAGYRLRPATSAAVVCDASIAVAQVHDVIVPAGTEITASTGVTFRTLADQRITTGSLTGSLVFTEGDPHTEVFTSDGSSFQKFVLGLPEVIYGSVVVTVNGTPWTISDSLIYGDGSSTIYTIDYDETDFATVQTGDNTNGTIPPVGSIVSVSYRVGGGVKGNVVIEAVNTSVTGYLDGVLPLQDISVAVVNNDPGAGGEERETIEHARFWIPRWISTNGRAVTEEDFDTLANAFNDPTYGSPAFCKCFLKQTIPELNTVVCSVWARDYGSNITTPSLGLKQALSTYFNNNGPGAVRIICTDVEVVDGEIVYVDVDATITISSEYASADVTSRVTTALNAYFATPTVRPGASVYLSDIYAEIEAIEGVDNSIINSITASKQATELIGNGDGLTVTFGGLLDLPVGLSVVPGTIQITAGSLVVTDDSDGHLTGDVTVTPGSNIIDYTTGVYSVTFSAAPAGTDTVQVTYRYVLDYTRWQQIATGDGTTGTYTGAISYPPILEYQPFYHQKGITFTDGVTTYQDNGSGLLFNPVLDPGCLAPVGTVDYDSGAYSFTFPVGSIPANGAVIACAYQQLLRTASENIPIEKSQVAVPGVYYLATQVSP